MNFYRVTIEHIQEGIVTSSESNSGEDIPTAILRAATNQLLFLRILKMEADELREDSERNHQDDRALYHMLSLLEDADLLEDPDELETLRQKILKDEGADDTPHHHSHVTPAHTPQEH